MRFGRLEVLGFDRMDDCSRSYWRVRCDCGVEFVCLAQSLKRGATRSCGCLRSERMAAMNKERKNGIQG